MFFSIIQENKCKTDKNMRILLGNILGGYYYITFGDGLVTVKPQPVTSNLSLLMSHHQ